MAVRLSVALLRYSWNVGSIAEALSGGTVRIYSGTQPDAPELAPTGTLLATITDTSGSWTAETAATGSVEITGSGSGSIDSLTVDGVELLLAPVSGTSKSDVAYKLYAALQEYSHRHEFLASYDGMETVTLTCRPGRGTKFNAAVVSGSLTTLSATYTDFSGGVDSVNGLWWGSAENYSNIAQMLAGTQTKTGTAVADGTAGWLRVCGPFADADADDTDYEMFRMDMAIGETGANVTIDDDAITTGETVTIATFAPHSTNGYTF